uniref:SRCR domain-containing protein n=1 Tax=Periophthalmus magnuspinnatus TaxID=409849 RepID=A0A3B4AGE9_9GOBI
MDCPRSGSETCSSGAAVNLTCSGKGAGPHCSGKGAGLTLSLVCSEPLRLVGGASRCAGTVEVKHRGEWRRMSGLWDLKHTAAVHCVEGSSSSLPSGLEVKLQIWDQSWTWVCEGALDQQGAEVLCRELGCGALSLLQGALSPLRQTFHCEGHESALMDCPRSGSETCSSGAAVNLTCSEVRLVGGASRCAGTVELRLRGEWRQVEPSGLWDLEDTAAVCRDLDCGSAVYAEKRDDYPQSPVWRVSSDCVKKSKVRECVNGSFSSSSPSGLEVKCLGKSLITHSCFSLSTHTHTHTPHTHTPHTHTVIG